MKPAAYKYLMEMLDACENSGYAEALMPMTESEIVDDIVTDEHPGSPLLQVSRAELIKVVEIWKRRLLQRREDLRRFV